MVGFREEECAAAGQAMPARYTRHLRKDAAVDAGFT
jgi:hypothetical protein